MSESFVFECDGEIAARAASDALARRDLRVVRSFDLRSAVTTHAGCDCPHHGTAECTCQFIVLLIYGAGGAPATLTAHSRDNWADLQITNDANAQPDPQLVEQITTALVEAALALQAARVSSPGTTANAS